MGAGTAKKPHAVCIPYQAQGHISPMLKLAELLNHKGFHITFVHTEFNHKRLLISRPRLWPKIAYLRSVIYSISSMASLCLRCRVLYWMRIWLSRLKLLRNLGFLRSCSGLPVRLVWCVICTFLICFECGFAKFKGTKERDH